MKSGMSPAEARRAALIESDGVEQVKERVRDVRAGNLLETLLRDIRFGARMLAKDPAFTAAAVTMLALGIGANTAVFSVVDAVLLRGLPYSQPDRIVALYEMRPRERELRGTVSPPDFLDWRDQSASFQNMAAIAHTPASRGRAMRARNEYWRALSLRSSSMLSAFRRRWGPVFEMRRKFRVATAP